MVSLHLENDCLQLRVLPDWAERVAAEDRPFLKELLIDWKRRAASDPQELFEQVLSAGVGPLAVQSVWSNLSHPNGIVEQLRGLMNI